METLISVKNLSIGYDDKCICRNIGFDVQKGELLGIVGCNGAGKSTLLKTIRGLIPKQEGEISYFGQAMEQLSSKKMAQYVAYLQQNVEVNFSYTAEEIVLSGRYPYLKWWEQESEADRALALECMDSTGTAELRDKPLNMVSGGQKQRILLAKVLAQQTPILFLDEPTTGLDVVYQEEIFRFARQLADMGKTVIMVVHELNLAYKYCKRIVLLGCGRLLADGAPSQVLTSKLLSQAYNVDVEVSHNPKNNNLEIATRISEFQEERTQSLLKKICCYQ